MVPKQLNAIDYSWREALAATLSAGLAAGAGRRESAIELLETALQEFDAISLRAYSAAAKNLCGVIRDDEQGRKLVEEAKTFLVSQQVQNHQAFLQMLLPGNWT